MSWSPLGCASIVSTNLRQVTVRSTPDDAEVVVIDEKGQEIDRARTPTTLTLKTGGPYFRGHDYTIVIRKEGYEDRSDRVRSTINGWYWGNFIFGGLIGFLVVDPLTGNMWSLSPREIDGSLQQKTAAAGEGDLILTVMLLHDVPHDLRPKMVRVK
jgi:hypothetical protein